MRERALSWVNMFVFTFAFVFAFLLDLHTQYIRQKKRARERELLDSLCVCIRKHLIFVLLCNVCCACVCVLSFVYGTFAFI